MKNNQILAIVGCDANEETIASLKAFGFAVEILPRNASLPLPVSSHADMLIFELGGCVFAERRYVDYASDIFNKIADWGYKVVLCDVSLGNKYPQDIAFNIATCDNTLFGNIKYNAAEVIEFAKSKAFKLQSVNQGYTKCSTVVLGNKAVITADDGIAKSAISNGLQVLKINNSPDSVTLNGYNYGFIGGACGVVNNKIYFSGDINLHPDGKNIINFCNSLGFETINLTAEKLVDIGGIIFLPRYS